MPNTQALHLLDRLAVIAILAGYALIVAGVALVSIAYALIVAGIGAILIGLACARYVAALERQAKASQSATQPTEAA